MLAQGGGDGRATAGTPRYTYTKPQPAGHVKQLGKTQDPRTRDLQCYTKFVLATNSTADFTLSSEFSRNYTFTNTNKTFRVATPNKHLATSLLAG